MQRIIWGNLISFVGSLFLFASCVAKSKRRVLLFQFFQCAILTAAQITFGKGAGAVSMAVAGTRNLIIASGHYGVFATVLVSLFTFVFGIYFNTGGVIGLMPVIASVFYSVALYVTNDVRHLKLALSVLLFVWIVYSALIFDIFGTISNTSAQILNLVTLARFYKRTAEK